MSQLVRLPLRETLQGLRVHARCKNERPAPAPRLEWLLNLQARAQREAQQGEVVTSCMQAITKALEQVPVQIERALAEVRGLAIELGLAIAREVVGQAAEQGLADPVASLQRCLASVVEGAERAAMVVAMHPMDLTAVLNEIELGGATAAQCTFEADPALARGVVRVTSGAGRLLYDPREVCERIAQELRKSAGNP